MTLKYCIRYLLLVVGFALLTYGMINWSRSEFSMQGLWLVDKAYTLHPLHFVIMGVAMIPPAMWEIFSLQHKQNSAQESQP